jgi:hypothetical protein
MKIIAIIDSEESGPWVVLDSDNISVIKCSDFYLAATYCAYTGRALTSEISDNIASELIENGVRCLDFNEELINPKDIKDKKSTD